jgi:hypothetical protein
MACSMVLSRLLSVILSPSSQVRMMELPPIFTRTFRLKNSSGLYNLITHKILNRILDMDNEISRTGVSCPQKKEE